MKKIYLSLVFIFLLSIPVATSAANTSNIEAGKDVLEFLGLTAQKGGLTDNPEAETDVMDIVAAIINTILSLTGIIFFAQMFYHGFRWMTSGGAEDIIKDSKQGIKQAIIGMIIIFFSFVATNFVLNRLESINSQVTTTPTAIDSPTPVTSQ